MLDLGPEQQEQTADVIDHGAKEQEQAVTVPVHALLEKTEACHHNSGSEQGATAAERLAATVASEGQKSSDQTVN